MSGRHEPKVSVVMFSAAASPGKIWGCSKGEGAAGLPKLPDALTATTKAYAYVHDGDRLPGPDDCALAAPARRRIEMLLPPLRADDLMPTPALDTDAWGRV